LNYALGQPLAGVPNGSPALEAVRRLLSEVVLGEAGREESDPARSKT
jgi:hypothetical protein